MSSTGADKSKLTITLRSILLLSEEALIVSICINVYTCNNHNNCMQKAETAIHADKSILRVRSLKRKVGYDDEDEEEVAETRNSFARLVISDVLASR